MAMGRVLLDCLAAARSVRVNMVPKGSCLAEKKSKRGTVVSLAYLQVLYVRI
jgi:hypothetical protein